MLNDADLERYARQVILEQIGEEGQERLRASKVLLIGLGGLGCPVAMYLALAGVGRVVLVDHDQVERSNLPRQPLFGDADLGRPKVMVAAECLGFLNPDSACEAVMQRFDVQIASTHGLEADLWIDASDNYITRSDIALSAAKHERRVVMAAVQGFQGHITTIDPGAENACFHGLFPTPPSDKAVSHCEQVGILGAVAGVLGTMLAVEAIKELLGIGQGLTNQILLYDGLFARVQKMKILHKRRDCSACPR
ncbi:MAG: HesA/MoeB/ThiF family protein [Alphaproteobacteria bacterium]|nr:HesA/MoeB/ThiF family protein [Alphaproteobacteria bacterium]